MREDKPQWGEWQEHDGGECPIPGAWYGSYEVRFRDGTVWHPATVDAERNLWDHAQHPRDIIAYRVRAS